jgi:diguanylate cyclase (GGDEF)-like protein/PAS domain S-box-containing protein
VPDVPLVTKNEGARAVGLLFLLFAGLVLLGLADSRSDRDATAAVSAMDLALATVALLVPWHRWRRDSTLVLSLPAFGIIAFCGATEVLPPGVTGIVFTLCFVWVGSYHSRGRSIWLLVPAASAYSLAALLRPHTSSLKPGSVVIMTGVWALVAEVIAHHQERMRRSLADMSFLVDNTTDLVTRLDERSVIRYVSPSVTQLLGWTPEEMVGQPSSHYRHPDDRGSVELTTGTIGEPVVSVRRLRHANGTYRWMESTARSVRTGHGHIEVLSTSRDITDRYLAQKELARRATHDPLTGLPNRDLLHQRLEALLGRTGEEGAAVVFLDLDGFKAVNDRHGHAAGDDLLREVGRRLRTATRGHDTVARYGGDEFVLLLADLHDPEEAGRVVARVEAALSQPWPIRDTELALSGSIGFIPVRAGATAEQLLAEADAAMYADKARRRPRRAATDYLSPPIHSSTSATAVGSASLSTS